MALAAAGITLGIALWGPTSSWGRGEGASRVTSGVAPDAPPIDPAPDLPGLANPGAIVTPRANDDDDATRVMKREWHLVSGKYWQIVGPPGEDPQTTDARENNGGGCPTGMVSVAGKMKVHFLLDDLQAQACTKWISKKWPERCSEFDRDKWLGLAKDIPTQPMKFCIDRFEYPNRKGAFPIIMVNWYEARDVCKSEGKRLCTEDEWTFACEGEEATPYPNGYVRNPDACVNDRPWKQFHAENLMPRSGEGAKRELDHLWQGQESGARPLCKSSFGVYDMTGNVDEWTRSSVPGERPSVLKGGYWGPVRTRCRPATKAHGEEHTFYQQGLRCCSDPGK